MMVNHTLVPSTQSNFTVLVSVTDATLKTVSNGGHVANSNGYDIGFYTDSSGSTKLKWQIDSYNPSTGQLIAWVKIPTLSSTSDTSFYLFYGDPSITTDQSDPVNTWDSNFKAVYHLGNGTTLSLNDSVGNHNGTSHNSPTAAAGKISGAVLLYPSDGWDYVTMASPSTFPAASGTWTISAWVKANATSSEYAIFDWGDADNNFFGLHQYYSQWLVRSEDPSTGSGAVGGTASTTAFKYVVGTLDGSNNITLYENGSQVDQATSIHRPNAFGTVDAELGVLPTVTNLPYDGWIDEVRISSVARSAAWITAEYNNQNSPGAFITMGSESCPSTTPTPTPTPTPSPVPNAPGNLTATAVSSSQINLSWTDNSGDENGFSIERCEGSNCTNFAAIAQVGTDVTSYQNGGLTRNTAYRYRVRAFNASGNSDYSNIAKERTPNR